MNKRGQLTAFIIIAIIVVAVGIFLSFFWPKVSSYFLSENQARALLDSQTESLRTAIQDCTEEVSKEIITDLGVQAGYYDYSHLYSIEFSGPKVVIMFKDVNKNRINHLPTRNKVEEEFKKAMDEFGYKKIDQCLGNLNNFKRTIEINEKEKNISINVDEEKVFVYVNWPMTVSKQTITGKVSQEINQRDIELNIPFGRTLNVAQDIINTEINQTDFVEVIDKYILTHAYSLNYVRINSQNYPTSMKTIYYINTIPYRTGEEEFRFYFAVDREEYKFI